VLRYMHASPNNAAFLRALPHAGALGSLHDRFTGTPVAGHVIAKTGSISHVNSLSGYVERRDGRTLTFSIIANNHDAKYRDALNAIDSVVVELGR
jgi:serine-type D-Ala-D-Ala carboxypeptidase/endopeptidase (penicillin-binding protein 4)